MAGIFGDGHSIAGQICRIHGAFRVLAHSAEATNDLCARAFRTFASALASGPRSSRAKERAEKIGDLCCGERAREWWGGRGGGHRALRAYGNSNAAVASAVFKIVLFKLMIHDYRDT